MINKKAGTGDQIMILPFLFLLLIITAGIITGIYIFFGSDYEFRKTDADLLNHKIKSCLSNNEIDWSNSENFFTTCDINQDITQEDFIIHIEKNGEVVYDYGDEVACTLSEKSSKYPKCTNSSLNQYSITVGSNQFKRSQIG